MSMGTSFWFWWNNKSCDDLNNADKMIKEARNKAWGGSKKRATKRLAIKAARGYILEKWQQQQIAGLLTGLGLFKVCFRKFDLKEMNIVH